MIGKKLSELNKHYRQLADEKITKLIAVIEESDCLRDPKTKCFDVREKIIRLELDYNNQIETLLKSFEKRN
jgi:hypothetical protein